MSLHFSLQWRRSGRLQRSNSIGFSESKGMDKCPCPMFPSRVPNEISFTLLLGLWEPGRQVHLINQSEVAHSLLNLCRFVGPRFVSITCVPNGRSPECLCSFFPNCKYTAPLGTASPESLGLFNFKPNLLQCTFP